MNDSITPDSNPIPKNSRARRVLLALAPGLLFLFLTILMTWPLVTDLRHSIVYGITADADVSRWDLWWLKTALLEEHRNPFYTDRLYFPYRGADSPLPLYYHTLQPLNGLLALPVLLLSDLDTGPTLAYNLLVLGHFIAAGWAMYALVRYLTGSTAGGLVAGALFTFSPFHQYHLHEAQLELIPIEWVPLFLLFLHRWLWAEPATAKRRDLVLATGCLIAASYTSWYWALYMLLAGAGLAAWRVLTARATWRRTALSFGALLAGWGVLVGPFLWATARAANDPTFELVSGLDYEVRFSLSPFDLLFASKDARMDPPVWFMGTLGVVALVLAGVGVWKWSKLRIADCGLRNSENDEPDPQHATRNTQQIIRNPQSAIRNLGTSAWFWLALGLGGAVLALGPYLRLNDAQDVVSSTGIPLPYYLVRNLPFLSIARVPRRFMLLGTVGLDVLAGAGAAWLVWRAAAWGRRVRGIRPAVWTTGVAGLLIAAALAEFAVIPQPFRPVVLSPFFDKLAAEPGDAPILELPITAHYLHDHQRMLYQSVHGRPMIGGYVARKVRDYYIEGSSPFHALLDMDPAPDPDILPAVNALAVLNYYKVPYLIAYKQDESYLSPIDRNHVLNYARSLFPDPADKVADDDLLTAYRVPTMPTIPAQAWVGDDWNGIERVEGRVWRWSQADDADLHILTTTPISGPLRFTSAAFQTSAHLTVSLNGQPIQTLALGPGEQVYDLGTIQIPPGINTLHFHSDTPPRPAAGGSTGRDQRLLAFLLRDVTLPGIAP